jgi:hypothetical protein
MKGDEIIFNLDETKTEVTRRTQAKTIGGRMCLPFKEDLLRKFVEWLGDTIPADVKKKDGLCKYIEFVIRFAISKGKEGIIRVTPEEYEIFSEDEHRPDLIKRMKTN